MGPGCSMVLAGSSSSRLESLVAERLSWEVYNSVKKFVAVRATRSGGRAHPVYGE